MPKKSASVRSNAHRNRPKAQKNVEPTSMKEPLTKVVATEAQEEPESAKSTPPRGRSAATMLATRRQSVQKKQQRVAAELITAEHFAYVQRDLVTITLLAVLMSAIIIVLYFVLGARA